MGSTEPVESADKISALIEAGQNDPVWWIENVLGVQLWQKQKEIAWSVRDHKYTCVQSGHNVGKAANISTLIPTPEGFKALGDLVPGDQVLDETGAPCRVTWVSPSQTPAECFEVVFSDRTTITACAEHQWYTEDDAERRRFLRAGDPTPGKVRTTRELYDGNTPVKRGKYRWSIPVISAPAQHSEKQLPIDPYVLGVWLGDGAAGGGLITKPDAEVFDEIRRRGYEVKEPPARDGISKRIVGLTRKLRGAGVLGNKHVPEVYFAGSVEQRIDLLRGLLDTDGTTGRDGQIEFCNSNPLLSYAVFRLAASLGCLVRRPFVGKSALYGVRKKDRHRVVFTATMRLFNIRRKADRQKPPGPRCRSRMLVDIKPVPSVPMRCIAVDSPRNLYLATDAYIPTHNSFVTACLCLWFHSCFPDSVVLTTANGWGQVKGVLWKEIRKLAKRSAYPLGVNFKPSHPESAMGLENWMFGFSPDKPDAVHGHHRDHILIVFDEAQGLRDHETWEAFSSMMTSAGSKQLAIGNPIYADGPFRDKFRNSNWSQIRMSCLDHPNYIHRRQVIPGAVTFEAVEELRADPMTGPGSLYWDTRVDGRFPSISDDTLLPEYFLRRNADIPADRILLRGNYIGFDPAEYGNDRSVCLVLKDGHVVRMDAWRHTNAFESAARVLRIATVENVPWSNINFDASGPVGGNLVQAFRKANAPVHPVFAGGEPKGDWAYFFSEEVASKLQFINRRAELHWTMRLLFENALIRVPMHYYRHFQTESCKLRFGLNEKGQLYIESKPNKFRPREGYSPDHNDALVLALARDQAPSTSPAPSSAKVTDDPTKIDPKARYGAWQGDARAAYGETKERDTDG